MGVFPILGRPFTANEELRRARVVLLSHGLWTSRFGSSPDVAGQMLQIDGINCQIVGVMPASFQFPAADSAFWAPITTNLYWGDPALQTNDPAHDRAFYARWQAIARLKSEVTQRAAQVEMDTIQKRLERVNPNRQRAPVLG